MDYRNTILHYYTKLIAKVVNHHFSEVFNYAKTEGEELPTIETQDVLVIGKGDKPLATKVIPTPITDEAPTWP